MMIRKGVSAFSVLLAALVIVSVVVSLGFGLYYLSQSSQVNQLQTRLQTDESQLANLNSLVSSLQSQVNSQSSSLASLSQDQQSQTSELSQLTSQLQGLQSSLGTLEGQVSTLVSGSQADSSQIQTIETEILAINSSISRMQTTINNLQPLMPTSTLVILSSSFNATSDAMSFETQNTWDGAVNAQLQVTVQCITRPGAIFYCPNPVGTYTSDVMQFAPDSTKTVSFVLSDVNMLSSGTMDQLQVFFESSTTTVSPTYTFQYP